jgi:hypothetical protein
MTSYRGAANHISFRYRKDEHMNRQSMGRAVITGASSGSSVVYADRLGLKKQQNTPDSSIREVLVGSSV